MAREKNTDFQFVLRRYAVERLLARLSQSPHRDQFVLKGAMLFTAWLEDPFRSTQDVDFLGYGDPVISRLEVEFRSICAVEVEDDALVFDIENLKAEAIREDQHYGGVRVKTTAFLGKTRIPVQADIGFGDAITPVAQDMEFPPLLSSEGPRLKAYPKETVVAEKLHAIVVLGQANSRMKDFYDLFALSRLFEFDGKLMVAAIKATFERRQTIIPSENPIGLSETFTNDEQKQQQWNAFIGRQPLMIEASSLAETISDISDFVLPPLKACSLDERFGGLWAVDRGWIR